MNKTKIIEDKIVHHEALTFDDILLLPNYTEIRRQEVDLITALHPNIILKLPVVSSPMDTVTEGDMAIALAQNGGLGVIHRNMSVEKEADMVQDVKLAKVIDPKIAAIDKKGRLLVSAAVGVGEDLQSRVEDLIKAEVDILTIDSSNGFSKFILDIIKFIKNKYSRLPIIAGNIATFDGAKALINMGADVIRVGMGPGSICTTRIVTGMGVPQISAISAAVRATDGTKTTVIADGGIRQFGDMAKALAFGAKAVMIGSLFAGFDQSPGKIITKKGQKFKSYRGMGSIAAMKKGGAERYGQSKNTDEKKMIPEGVEGLVPYKGKINDYLYQIAGSLKSSFYYLGSKNIDQFFENSRAIKISLAGLIESHPHEILITDSGKNYHQ